MDVGGINNVNVSGGTPPQGPSGPEEKDDEKEARTAFENIKQAVVSEDAFFFDCKAELNKIDFAKQYPTFSGENRPGSATFIKLWFPEAPIPNAKVPLNALLAFQDHGDCIEDFVEDLKQRYIDQNFSEVDAHKHVTEFLTQFQDGDGRFNQEMMGRMFEASLDALQTTFDHHGDVKIGDVTTFTGKDLKITSGANTKIIKKPFIFSFMGRTKDKTTFQNFKKTVSKVSAELNPMFKQGMAIGRERAERAFLYNPKSTIQCRGFEFKISNIEKALSSIGQKEKEALTIRPKKGSEQTVSVEEILRGLLEKADQLKEEKEKEQLDELARLTEKILDAADKARGDNTTKVIHRLYLFHIQKHSQQLQLQENAETHQEVLINFRNSKDKLKQCKEEIKEIKEKIKNLENPSEEGLKNVEKIKEEKEALKRKRQEKKLWKTLDDFKRSKPPGSSESDSNTSIAESSFHSTDVSNTSSLRAEMDLDDNIEKFKESGKGPINDFLQEAKIGHEWLSIMQKNLKQEENLIEPAGLNKVLKENYDELSKQLKDIQECYEKYFPGINFDQFRTRVEPEALEETLDFEAEMRDVPDEVIADLQKVMEMEENLKKTTPEAIDQKSELSELKKKVLNGLQGNSLLQDFQLEKSADQWNRLMNRVLLSKCKAYVDVLSMLEFLRPTPGETQSFTIPRDKNFELSFEYKKQKNHSYQQPDPNISGLSEISFINEDPTQSENSLNRTDTEDQEFYSILDEINSNASQTITDQEGRRTSRNKKTKKKKSLNKRKTTPNNKGETTKGQSNTINNQDKKASVPTKEKEGFWKKAVDFAKDQWNEKNSAFNKTKNGVGTGAKFVGKVIFKGAGLVGTGAGLVGTGLKGIYEKITKDTEEQPNIIEDQDQEKAHLSGQDKSGQEFHPVVAQRGGGEKPGKRNEHKEDPFAENKRSSRYQENPSAAQKENALDPKRGFLFLYDKMEQKQSKYVEEKKPGQPQITDFQQKDAVVDIGNVNFTVSYFEPANDSPDIISEKNQTNAMPIIPEKEVNALAEKNARAAVVAFKKAIEKSDAKQGTIEEARNTIFRTFRKNLRALKAIIRLNLLDEKNKDEKELKRLVWAKVLNFEQGK